MKRLHLSLLFLLAVLTASSQKVYFIYVQTESEQPFFIKMNEKVKSSTASGYIILSKLLDSTYNFSVGFPQNKWPEQNFVVTVNKQDHGYILKNFGEKGWGLFDLQTLAVQMAISGKAGIGERPKIEYGSVSPFTEILSMAAGDPSLKEKPLKQEIEEKKTEIAVQVSKSNEEPKVEPKETVGIKSTPVVELPVEKKEESKPEIKEIVKSVKKIEPPVVNKEETKTETIIHPVPSKAESITEIKEQPASHTEEIKDNEPKLYKASQVKRWSESSTTEGFGLVFIDDYEDGIKDTIRLVIPNPKPINEIEKEEPKQKKKFIEIGTEAPKEPDVKTTGTVEQKIETNPVITDPPVENTIVKNICNETASESDFFKLRKKMAAIVTDDDMVTEAKKYFKTKCFSSAQLKNLSTLFLNDEGKYKFFDAAYKYVSDIEAFSSLQSELKDEYYTTRFKAMLRN